MKIGFNMISTANYYWNVYLALGEVGNSTTARNYAANYPNRRYPSANINQSHVLIRDWEKIVPQFIIRKESCQEDHIQDALMDTEEAISYGVVDNPTISIRQVSKSKLSGIPFRTVNRVIRDED